MWSERTPADLEPPHDLLGLQADRDHVGERRSRDHHELAVVGGVHVVDQLVVTFTDQRADREEVDQPVRVAEDLLHALVVVGHDVDGAESLQGVRRQDVSGAAPVVADEHRSCGCRRAPDRARRPQRTPCPDRSAPVAPPMAPAITRDHIVPIIPSTVPLECSVSPHRVARSSWWITCFATGRHGYAVCDTTGEVEMYGDSEVVRRRASQLREQGADVRALADQLVAQTESLGWTGRAAESMRAADPGASRPPPRRRRAARDRSRVPRAPRPRGRDHPGHHRGDRAQGRRPGRGGAHPDRPDRVRQREPGRVRPPHRCPDADDRTLADFTPPPSGHRDWLTVDLPGL